MTVLVIRRDDKFSKQLRDAGVEVINLELVSTEALGDLGEFENLISRVEEYDGIFFTSPVAAQVFADNAKPPIRPTLYTLGTRASAVLEDAGFVVKKVPRANTADEMLSALGKDEFVGKKLIFVRGERSMRTIPERLAAIAKVDEVAVYHSVEISPADGVVNDIRQQLTSGDIEWVCFFSPLGAEAFEKRFGAVNVSAAAIGETTAEAARELGFKADLVASRATNDVFARELIERVTSV